MACNNCNKRKRKQTDKFKIKGHCHECRYEKKDKCCDKAVVATIIVKGKEFTCDKFERKK